jgi:hypothetical protein
MTDTAPSLPPLQQKPIGEVRHGNRVFTLKVTRFDGYERLRPIIAWVWHDGTSLGYIGGLTSDEGDLTLCTQSSAPVDRALIWPEEDDVTMFARFRALWAAAGYGGKPCPESDDGVIWLGEFQLFGTTYTAWRNMDVPTTIRFARGGTEIGKLIDVGSYPQLKLHLEKWPVYRRHEMRFKLLALLAAQEHSP